MKLIQVNTKAEEKDFIRVPKVLYKNDPVWVCPLDNEIKDMYNPAKNTHLKNGEASRWIIKDNSNKILGRISTFHNYLDSGLLKTGRIIQFDCIEDQEVANLLFNAATAWLRNKGSKVVDGPVSFGENDSNWGLLVDGFTHPAYGMPYNFPYYKSLFENYGFQLYFKQYSYHLDLNKKFPGRFWKIAEWISKKPDFSFRHFNWKEADKFVNDMVLIYNSAWSAFKEDFRPIDPADIREGMNKSKPILDEELIWFAYHKNEPIGFFILFPDINQILKKLNGKLHFLNKIRFYYYTKTKTINRLRAQVAGVVPKFQNSGVESGIFWNLQQMMDHKPHYQEIELSWVGDFNPKMIALYETVGGVRAKTHYTYRYMLDPSIPFQRFMPDKVNVPLARKKAKQVIDDNIL